MEVDPDTGELLNADQLDALSAAFDEKAEATALYIKNLTAFVGDVKAEEAALAERRKTAEKRVERLKDLLRPPCCPSAVTRSKRPGRRSASASPPRFRSTTKVPFPLTS